MSAIEKQLEDFGGGITHHFSDGLYAKEAFVPAGTAILKHTHDFSHLSILAKGKVFVSTQRTRKTLRKWMTF